MHWSGAAPCADCAVRFSELVDRGKAEHADLQPSWMPARVDVDVAKIRRLRRDAARTGLDLLQRGVEECVQSALAIRRPPQRRAPRRRHGRRARRAATADATLQRALPRAHWRHRRSPRSAGVEPAPCSVSTAGGCMTNGSSRPSVNCVPALDCRSRSSRPPSGWTSTTISARPWPRPRSAVNAVS